jgi:hypothetical protein
VGVARRPRRSPAVAPRRAVDGGAKRHRISTCCSHRRTVLWAPQLPSMVAMTFEGLTAIWQCSRATSPRPHRHEIVHLFAKGELGINSRAYENSIPSGSWHGSEGAGSQERKPTMRPPRLSAAPVPLGNTKKSKDRSLPLHLHSSSLRSFQPTYRRTTEPAVRNGWNHTPLHGMKANAAMDEWAPRRHAIRNQRTRFGRGADPPIIEPVVTSTS